jgi:hypothetical protein
MCEDDNAIMYGIYDVAVEDHQMPFVQSPSCP